MALGLWFADPCYNLLRKIINDFTGSQVRELRLKVKNFVQSHTVTAG